MKIKLPSSIASSQDLAALILDVREYAKWFSHVAIKKRLKLQRGIDPPTISPGAKEVIRDWEAKQPLSTASFDELIRTLEDYKSSAPALAITLAAPAPGDLKKTLVAWCRDNIEPDVLVTFQFNATLLGGMVVHYGSRTFDWSFRRQILNGRAAFPEVLRRV
jgi:hypothetical protein